MENEKLLSLRKSITWLLFSILSIYSYAKVPTPSSVRTFYEGMKEFSQSSDANTIYYISKAMKESFLAREKFVSGGSLYNDFKFFKYDQRQNTHNDDTLSTSTYVDRLQEYINKDKVLTVEYSILNSEYTEQPDFNKGKLIASKSDLIATYVTKIYRFSSEPEKAFNDTVYTDIQSSKINEIRNGYGKSPININSLKNQASTAFLQKRYYDAYKCYEKIIAIAPNDGDALYRIALMTYYQKGCYFSKKKAHNKGKEYMQLAQQHGRNTDISGKAENVLFWWHYGSSM